VSAGPGGLAREDTSMMELMYFRPDYVIVGDDAKERRLTDPHRAMRTAMAIAAMFGVSAEAFDRATKAIEAMEDPPEGERRFMPSDVAALAAVTSQVATELDLALDDDHRPRGEGGERIMHEAVDARAQFGKRVDPHQVFVVYEDGRVGLGASRLNLHHFRDTLADLVDFLAFAVKTGLPVIVDG
jgi:hypothetical protein